MITKYVKQGYYLSNKFHCQVDPGFVHESSPGWGLLPSSCQLHIKKMKWTQPIDKQFGWNG